MNNKETQRLIELIRCLSEKKKREFYYMALGAAFAAKAEVSEYVGK